jgi:hypothetical protein
MGIKGKAAARAGAGDRNDKEVDRLIGLLSQEQAEHAQTERENTSRAALRGEVYTKKPFKTSLSIAKLSSIGAFEGGKVFKIETADGSVIRASTIDNTLKELLTKPKTSPYVLIATERRNEILVSLNNTQVESFVTLGLKGIEKEESGLFEDRPEDDLDVDDI